VIATTAELALVAVTALLRYRERVDEILALNEAKRSLPFQLPPAPRKVDEHFQPMLAYFASSDVGRAALVLHGLTQAYDAVCTAPGPPPQNEVNRLFHLYFELAEIRPRLLAPNASDEELQQAAGTGPSEQMRLAYYVVESHRLSRNPALTRLLLAAADTLLETLGQNAGLFLSNPKTRAFVETLLDEFAVKHDFDDEGAERIVKRLLGSAAIAAFEQRGRIPEQPALKALAGAFGDVYAELRKDPAVDAADFLVGLTTERSFDRLVSTFLTNVAGDPSFLSSELVAREVVAATLKDVAKNVPAIRKDPKALLGSLEVALAVGADHVDPILRRELGGKPLATAVLGALAAAVGEDARANDLFARVASGEIVADLYAIALRTVAANPGSLETEAQLGPFATGLVTSFAGALSDTSLRDALGVETLRAVVSRSLAALAAHPELLARDHAFAGRVLEETLRAVAPLVADGVTLDDLLGVVEEALRASAENADQAGLAEPFGAVLSALVRSFAASGLRALLGSEGRSEALRGALHAVLANPALWRGLAHDGHVGAVIDGLVSASMGAGALPLSAPARVELLQRCLLALAQHGASLLDGKLEPGDLGVLVSKALEAARAQLGRGLDLDLVPELAGAALALYLGRPFSLHPLEASKVAALVELALGRT